MDKKGLLFSYWNTLYPQEPVEKLQAFLDKIKEKYNAASPSSNAYWYKDAVVYSLYVDRSL